MTQNSLVTNWTYSNTTAPHHPHLCSSTNLREITVIKVGKKEVFCCRLVFACSKVCKSCRTFQSALNWQICLLGTLLETEECNSTLDFKYLNGLTQTVPCKYQFKFCLKAFAITMLCHNHPQHQSVTKKHTLLNLCHTSSHLFHKIIQLWAYTFPCNIQSFLIKMIHALLIFTLSTIHFFESKSKLFLLLVCNWQILGSISYIKEINLQCTIFVAFLFLPLPPE